MEAQKDDKHNKERIRKSIKFLESKALGQCLELRNLIIESFWQVLKAIMKDRADEYLQENEKKSNSNNKSKMKKLSKEQQNYVFQDVKPCVDQCGIWFASLYSDKYKKDETQKSKLIDLFVKTHVAEYPKILQKYPGVPMPSVLR